MELGPCVFDRNFDRNGKAVYFGKISYLSEANDDTVAGSRATVKCLEYKGRSSLPHCNAGELSYLLPVGLGTASIIQLDVCHAKHIVD